MKHKLSKRMLSILLAMVMLVGLLPTAAIPVFAVEESEIYAEDSNYEHGYFLGGAGAYEGGTWVREVYDWSDLVLVFQDLNETAMTMYGYVTVKLMNDLSMDHVSEASVPLSMIICTVSGWSRSNIVFDFNGHTLNGTRSSTTDYSGGAFIELRLISGNCFTFIDSVGGGGINFSSEADHDNDVAALYINASGERGEGYNVDDPDSYPAKVTFNGGSYKLNNSIERYSRGTLLCRSITYRGTVIANYVDVEINDGTFIAESECKDSDDDTQDLSARELSAFGTVLTNPSGLPEETNPEYGVVIPFEETGRTVINGGRFISDGYAVHHFDNCYEYLSNNVTDLWANNTGDLYHNEAYVLLDSHFHMNYPTINGGYFEGQLGFTGLTYTYSEGNPDLCIRPTSQIIPETSRYFGFDKDDNITFDTLIWKKLHDLQKCIVISEEALGLEVTPEGDGNPVKLIRNAKQSDTFEMSWTVPSYLEGEVVCQPTITITRPNSNIEPKTYSKSKVTVDYSEYPNDVNISCRLYVLAGGVGGELVYFKQNYEVDVKRVYTATDGCIHCYVTGDNGWDEIVEGGSCSFKIYPKDYYELTDPDALEVYVNGDLVTPDGDGVYTVENVTEDLDIYCDGSGFTSYSNLTITANGKTVTEKIFDGDTYTFKTLAEFGATVPAGSTFTGWKIGGKTYQPGETFTVTGTGEIAVNAAFTGLYNVTVENGKAYADEAHTQPITHAAEDQVIYIVADPAPEGKVFKYWNRSLNIGAFGDDESTETTYTVRNSDIVLSAYYATIVDEVIINGLTKPVAGATVEDPNYAYKFGMSIPEDAGYAFSYAYLYDTTTDEDVFVSNGDIFQAGHSYRYDIRINSRVQLDYYFPDDIQDLFVILSGIDTQEYVMTLSYPSSNNLKVSVEFICEGTTEDVVSVSGSISSHGASSPVTVELWNVAGTSVAYSTTISGDSTTYSIPDVATGVYELIVLKAGHMPFRYTFVAKGEAVTQDAELNLYADTNFDGEIDENDYQALVNAVLQDDHEQIETAEYDDLIHYDLVMDGYLDALDAAVMALVVNGLKTIEEVYDIKKGDYDYDGEAYTESDLIAMYHVLSDIDSSAPTLSTSQKFASDLNYNGKVDEDDLNRLISRYGDIEETTCEENVKVYYRWGNSYTTCTATAICTICDKHVAKETVNSVKNADGSYTATFTNTLLGTKTYKKTTT